MVKPSTQQPRARSAPAAPPQAPETAPSTKPGRKVVPWEKIEPHYRAGIRSLDDIGKEFGVSAPAIFKHAKKHGWDRDLNAKIQAKAEAKVNAALVNGQVNATSKAAESAIVEANATAVAEVRIAHRADIRRARGVVNNLLIELEGQTGGDAAATLEQLGELMRKPDDKGMDKLNDLYQKVISLPGRAKTMKDLGESLRVLIGLERQAFGMNDKGDDEPPPGFGGKSLTDVERAVRLMHFMGAGARP